MTLIDSLANRKMDSSFQKLIKSGLVARDVVPVQILGEKKARLALLCESKKQVYAVICVSTTKTDAVSIFTLLGHSLQAKRGVISGKVRLSNQYEGLDALLVVAEDVSVKKAGSNC